MDLVAKLKLEIDQKSMKGFMGNIVEGATGKGDKASGGVGKMIGQLGMIGALLNQTVELMGKMTRYLSTMSPAMMSVVRMFETSITLLIRPFSDFMATALRPLASELLKFAREWNSFWRKMFPTAGEQQIVGGVMAAGAVGGGIAGGLAGGPPGAVLGAAVGALAGGLGTIIGKGIADFNKWLAQFITDSITNFSAWLTQFVTGPITNFGGWLTQFIGDSISSFGGWLNQFITTPLANFGTWLIQFVAGPVPNFGGWLAQFIAAPISAFGSWLAGFITDNISNFGGWLFKFIQAPISNFGTWLAGFVSRPLMDFGSWLAGFIGKPIADFGAWLLKFFTGGFTTRQHGGGIPETGLYMLHKNETVLTAGATGRQYSSRTSTYSPTYVFRDAKIYNDLDIQANFRRANRESELEMRRRGLI